MADTDIVQVIAEARVDARSLSEFISKDKTFMVTRRLAPTVHTLDYYISAFNDVESNLNAAIDTVAQNADAAVADIVQDKTAELDGAVTRANATADSVATSAISTAASTAKTRIDKILNDAIKDSGFVIVDSFEDGATLTTATQALRVKATGKLYRWGGALPKTVAASSTPETTGGFGLDAWVEVNDVALKQELAGLGGHWLVNNQMAANAYGIPAPIANAKNITMPTYPVGYFNKTLWGVNRTDLCIYKSNDFGDTWVKHSSRVGVTVLKLLPTGDGEVLAQHSGGIIKSSGWSANPAVASWDVKVSKPSGNTADFLKWGFDGHDSKFAATHYGSTFSDSRYIWLSKDYGDTWDIVYDSNERDPVQGPQSHIHALCYDKWADRWYFAEGHADIAGTYYSDDDGETWVKPQDNINGQPRSPGFTTMTATDFGIVCGTDGHPNGIWLIRRTENPEDIELEYLASWSKDAEGVLGFADHSFRDPDTGIVYVGFGNAGSGIYANIPHVLYAVGSSGANVVYTGAKRVYSVFAAEGKILAKIGASGIDWIKADTSKYGGSLNKAVSAIDRGNLGLGEGEFTRNSSVRLGVGSSAKGLSTLALGRGASANDQDCIAVGSKSTSSGNGSIAIGNNSNAVTQSLVIGSGSSSSAFGVALGHNSVVTATAGVAIGRLAKSTQGVSVGGSATSTSANGISIGYNTSTTASIVIGNGISAESSMGIMIGYGSIKTTGSAVSIGVGSESLGGSSVAIGSAAKASEFKGVALGPSATASGSSSALGSSATASGASSVGIGSVSTAIGSYSIAIGRGANSGTTYSTSIGADSTANGANSISIGRGSSSESADTISIGNNATTSGVYNIAIGRNTSVSEGSSSIAFGDSAKSTGVSSISIGTGANSSFGGGVAIGLNAKATHSNSVAIGSASESVRANSVSIGVRDLESTKDGGAIYLKSPDGTAYKITVSDAGELTVAAV